MSFVIRRQSDYCWRHTRKQDEFLMTFREFFSEYAHNLIDKVKVFVYDAIFNRHVADKLLSRQSSVLTNNDDLLEAQIFHMSTNSLLRTINIFHHNNINHLAVKLSQEILAAILIVSLEF